MSGEEEYVVLDRSMNRQEYVAMPSMDSGMKSLRTAVGDSVILT